jgi:hypothetical protein
MSIEEECATKEQIGVLHNGKIFWYNRKKTLAEREEKHIEAEERDTSVVLHIEGIPHIEEKEKYRQLNLVEEYPLHPTQTRIYRDD